MAASGFVADFARMPTQRKVLVFVVIGGLLGLVYWKFGYQSLEEKLDAAEAANETKVQTNRKLAMDIPKYEELRSHMVRLKELIERNQAMLPSARELPAFLQTLRHKVNEAGATEQSFNGRDEETVVPTSATAVPPTPGQPGQPAQPAQPPRIQTFIKVPVDIEIAGTFMQIKRFFASLVQRDIHLGNEDRAGDERERIVSIENLSLSVPTQKTTPGLLTAKFTAVTFRQEDKPMSPKPAPGAPAGAAKPAAPPPAIPSAPPPPLPSTSPAADAKARTENALEKGDARNRGPAGTGDGKPSAGSGAGAGSDRLKGGL